MKGELLSRLVFSIYFLLMAIWVGAYAITLWIDKKTARGLAFSLATLLFLAGSVWAFLQWGQLGLTGGLIGLAFLLALVFRVARALKSSLKK